MELWLYLENTKLVQILHDARALEAARVGVWVGVLAAVTQISAGLLLFLETQKVSEILAIIKLMRLSTEKKALNYHYLPMMPVKPKKIN